jgi:hypothetical protein
MSSWGSHGDDGERLLPFSTRRERQITFCRELIEKSECSNWDDFVASMTAQDRMNLYLTGLSNYAVLKREFRGMENDARRYEREMTIEERARQIMASLKRCSVRLQRDRRT